MEKQLFLRINNNNIVHRKITTAPGKYRYEAMVVPETLMHPDVDHSALFDLAYDTGAEHPENMAVADTLEDAIDELIGRDCGPVESICGECNGTGSPHPDYGGGCYSCRGSGVIK